MTLEEYKNTFETPELWFKEEVNEKSNPPAMLGRME